MVLSSRESKFRMFRDSDQYISEKGPLPASKRQLEKVERCCGTELPGVGGGEGGVGGERRRGEVGDLLEKAAFSFFFFPLLPLSLFFFIFFFFFFFFFSF